MDMMGMMGGMPPMGGEMPGGAPEAGMDSDKLKEILMMLLDMFISQGGDIASLMGGGGAPGGMPPAPMPGGMPSGSEW